MTRLKRVVEPGMVAHLWAHEAQDEARNARGNFFFHGDTIYSYGHHFPVARHVRNKRGEHAVLLTTRTYSSTTAGHIQCVAGACRHQTVFHVEHPNTTPGKLDFEQYRQRQTDLMRKLARARNQKPNYWAQIRELNAEANRFAEFFGLSQRLKMPSGIESIEAEVKAIEKREAARQKRELRKREIAEKKRLAELENRLEEWVLGAGNDCYFGGLPVRLRLVGKTLETSLGAEVPVKDAKRCFRILKKLRRKAATYQRNGETITVGPFALDSMDSSGVVRVGCHEIAWAEIERVAKLAGLKF